MVVNLENPKLIGPNLGGAFMSIAYGVLIANMVMPISGRLREASTEESFNREMMIEGLVALSESEPPSLVKERMELFLAPQDRSNI